MSFDPFAPGSDLPPEYGPAPLPPGDRTSSAWQRVQAPAIALIVVGILNLLLTLVQIGKSTLDALKTPEQLAKEREELIDKVESVVPGFRKAYEQSEGGASAEGLKTQAVITGAIASALALLTALLSLIGGVRMRQLRSYGLSVAGAISAAIPCITCSGTCCFGEIIGIWALVVLLSTEVRSTFQ